MSTALPPAFGNLLTPPPSPAGAETFDPLLQDSGFRLERIFTPAGTDLPGPWYDQPHDEWVLVVQGRAVLEFAGGLRHALSAGDYLHLPAHCIHRVKETDTSEPVVWLALHWTSSSSSREEQ